MHSYIKAGAGRNRLLSRGSQTGIREPDQSVQKISADQWLKSEQ